MSTGTRTVRADLPNPDGLLKAGAFVTVTLPYAGETDALLVRDASIGTDQQGKYLYVVNDSNRVEYRSIRVGQLIDDSLRLVTHGLQPRERYVTRALLKVHDGMIVNPVSTP
jgi:multidrug efflux pump subunit AcrA (membrane-fusion protein)